MINRQHNSPDRFQSYFEETMEKRTSTGKQLSILRDFNIDLLKFYSSRYSNNFLVSLQSYYLIPTIHKPACVHNNSATLIVNIFVNKPEEGKISGTLISDISDHFSQFCIVKSTREKPKEIYKTKVNDYSRFSADNFDDELSQTEWGNILFNATGDIDKTFFMKTLSHRKAKQFSNPNSKLLEK